MKTLEELKKQLALALSELDEIEKSIPAHSVRPSQLMALEEAEENVRVIREKIQAFHTNE